MNLDLQTLEKKYIHAEPTLKPNFNRIPVVVFTNNDDDIKEFNEVYAFLKTLNFEPLPRTKSGGISYRDVTKLSWCWDIRTTPSSVEITIICYAGMFRFAFRPGSLKGAVERDNNEKLNNPYDISGSRAFAVLKKELKKDGIDLEDYKVENGKEINETIEKPIIKMADDTLRDITIENVHHIDIHSAWPSGIAEAYPEMAPTWNRIYLARKQNPVYKQILNKSIGVMHSKIKGWRWANLAKAGIESCNRKIEDLTKRLEKNGNIIIAYNTDGIWYTGDVYHGEGEGSGLGEWVNDHINTTFRARSAGAYEYIENDEYHVVLRGRSKLDLIKPRTDWEWGDLYHEDAAKVFMVHFDEKTGITQVEGDIYEN